MSQHFKTINKMWDTIGRVRKRTRKRRQKILFNINFFSQVSVTECDRDTGVNICVSGEHANRLSGWGR